MKRAIILSLALAIQLISFGQDEIDYSNLSFVAYWSIGDSYDYEVTKIKKKWEAGVLTTNDSTQYLVNFEVIDSTETSYKVKWSHKMAMIDTYDFSEEEMEVFNNYEDIDVIFTTTELGEFVEIENWKEIKDLMNNVMDELIAILTKDQTEEERELFLNIMKPLTQMYQSQQGIELLVYNELQYFHFPLGMVFNIEKPIEYEDILPNMLGGKPIRGDAKITFEDVFYDEQRCIFKHEMQLNEKDTKSLLQDVFDQMGIKDKEIDKMVKSTKFLISDSNKFEFYYYPGLPKKIETNRTSEVKILKEDVRSLDRVIIEMVSE